jgi:hypothetical protein
MSQIYRGAILRSPLCLEIETAFGVTTLSRERYSVFRSGNSRRRSLERARLARRTRSGCVAGARRALTSSSNDPPRSPATKAAAVAPKVPRVGSRPGEVASARVAWNPRMPAGSAPKAPGFGSGECSWAGARDHPRRSRAECGARRQPRQLPQTNLAYQMYPMKKDE